MGVWWPNRQLEGSKPLPIGGLTQHPNALYSRTLCANESPELSVIPCRWNETNGHWSWALRVLHRALFRGDGLKGKDFAASEGYFRLVG